MKKRIFINSTIFIIGLLVISSSIFLPTKPQYVKAQTTSGRSVFLDNYNNWREPVPGSADYQTELNNLAQRDRVVMNERYSQASQITPAILKTINLNTKVFRYYILDEKPTTDTDGPDGYRYMPVAKSDQDSNNWWLRDGDGNIVMDGDLGMPLIDLGKVGVKEAILSNILERTQNKGYDGILLDGWGPSVIKRYIENAGKPYPPEYQNEQEWYEKAWKPNLEYIASGLKSAGYQVALQNIARIESSSNNEMQQWAREQVDAASYENFAVDTTGNWFSGLGAKWSIDSFASDPLEIWTADFGIKETDPLHQQKAKVALAMYYLGLPDDPSQQVRRFFNYYGNSRAFWDPLWDFDIGTPSANRVQIPDKYAWQRKYSNGVVLLNYGVDTNDNTEINFTLDKEYVDKAGTVYSGDITLPAHTALILQTKAPIMPANKVIVTKSASANMALAGDTITFTISVNNQSATTANNVILTDPIDPTQLQFVDADRNAVLTNNQVTWPSLNIPINQTETFTFRARVL